MSTVMRQVFYIEADEEMISVIGRLRKSSASENIIVAPQRSLILQSIVNLRLLSHDARKNGKEIVVITQDAQSRSLCEKAGIRTQEALDEDMVSSHQVQYSSAPASSPAIPPLYTDKTLQQHDNTSQDQSSRTNGMHFPHAETLGTQDFFGETTLASSPYAIESQKIPLQTPSQKYDMDSFESAPSPYGDVKQVSVRDKNPKKLTTLNSQRFEDEQLHKQQKSHTPPSLRGTESVRPIFTPPPAPRPVSMPPAPHPHASLPTPSYLNAPPLRSAPQPHQAHQSHQEPASDLFERHAKADASLHAPIQQNMTDSNLTVVSDGGKMRVFVIFFGVISILSVVFVGAYLLLPEATVHVKQKAVTQKADFEFSGAVSASAPSADNKIIPVKIIEKDQELSHSFPATGKASLADQKSRGSVIISNEYSTDKQLLVASTRFISQDGKVFRLLSGVIVPGMTGAVAGTVEAAVVADQAGTDYNVPATTFTIPGFEGTPKYTKFTVKSTNAMTGGGTSGSDALTVSDEDIAKAKKSVEAEAKATAADVLGQSLNEGEKVLREATDVSIVSGDASPKTGAVANAFDYHVKVHVKTFVFSETDLKKMISTLLAKQNTSQIITLAPSDIAVQYGEPIEDFTAGTLRISVHAEGRFASDLDQTQLKADLAGQANDGNIAALLQKYTQLETISVEIKPTFLTNKIPSNEDKITIIVDPRDDGSGK